jgi:cation transport regulator
MPYKQITQLPDNVKNNLPKHAQEIYKEAFNSAEDQYGEEGRAHATAWSAVEKQVREERPRQLGPEGELILAGMIGRTKESWRRFGASDPGSPLPRPVPLPARARAGLAGPQEALLRGRRPGHRGSQASPSGCSRVPARLPSSWASP